MLVPGLIILFALGAGILSAVQYVEAQNAQDRAEKAQEDAKVKADSLIVAQSRLSTTQRELQLEQQKANQSLTELNASQKEVIATQKKVDELQNETLRHVLGYGYPIVITMPHQGNLRIALKGSTDYPILRLFMRVVDATKLRACPHIVGADGAVQIPKSCYETCVLFEATQTMDLNGTAIVTTDLYLPKARHFLETTFNSKHLRSVQYTIIDVDGAGNVYTSHKIFEVSSKDNSFGRMLEEVNPAHIPEKIWEDNFFLRKKTLIDHNK